MTPIVFVPGLLCSAEAFAPQSVALWEFGPITTASTLSGETIAEMAAAVLANAPPRFALVGISMGGYICMEIMRQAPERVARLALLDTSAQPDTPEQTSQRRVMLARARESDFAAWSEETLTSILHPSRRADANLRQINRRMGQAVGLEGFARQTEAVINRPDSRPGLAAIRVPTLVLVGDCDALTPPERSEEIASLIPGATLVVVPDCGHASTIEQPLLVSLALARWLQE
ncbi:alpha/beta fold hydrolase [Siculibacillus lacustris]|uniref:Alpha/beta fold hydrolase n=1 Tax=Siculibacillus lacustris TaxID=1549641 RepID=A0A4Q9VFT0_9HYPH|nr:alpha/beta fold hydrolase [Siculibacillus lacustris]TBW33801.1 alpha/beta fold hydrolase [Siculibacillus lacustris]